MIKKILDKANYLTFLGLIFAIIGIQMCFINKIGIAVILLMFCGICDGFDGYVARIVRKNSDEDDKKFGIEIDSIADIVCFGVFPIVILTSMGFNSIIDIVIYCMFIICGACRLAYYNTSEKSDYFEGVPITFSAILIPILYILTKCELIYIAFLFVLTVLYVSKIKIKKLGLKGKIAASVCAIIIAIIIIVLMQCIK